ncbi:MAG: ISAzo13 family transposase, partial [Actinobacteria bacterium]|nr:ISAzo13 family transposase [Actinomycetota bacterium]
MVGGGGACAGARWGVGGGSGGGGVAHDGDRGGQGAHRSGGRRAGGPGAAGGCGPAAAGGGRPCAGRGVGGVGGARDPGDPQSPLRWTSKSTGTLADELHAQGHPAGARTVAKLLKRLGYSLQANAKTREGKQHPDRDAQFRYLSGQVNDYLAAGDPVISVDTKKKLRH